MDSRNSSGEIPSGTGSLRQTSSSATPLADASAGTNEAVLVMPCERPRLVGMLMLPAVAALSFVGVYALLEYLWFGQGQDSERSKIILMMSVSWLILFVLHPAWLLARIRFGIGSCHILKRSADGRLSLERAWCWGSRVLHRKPVDVSEYTWVWVKCWGWRELSLELGVTDEPGTSRYRVYPLSVVNAFGRFRFRPEEVEADKSRLLTWGEQVAALMGLENRGFSLST
ncbi:MAG: hypothetical protein Q4B17_14720 [Lautropia sp.]|nr:hypothetical protein [Lautropia sp.]